RLLPWEKPILFPQYFRHKFLLLSFYFFYFKTKVYLHILYIKYLLKSVYMAIVKESSTNQFNKRLVTTKCPVTFIAYKMGNRWKPLVIRELFSGTKRYGELKRAIPPISEKMLIQTLKELEVDGIINRKAMPVVPPHVEYTLTDSGQDLEPVIAAMVKWSLKYNIQ
ncbi:MAG: helix-turn-helix domain-containing protein, partial [Mucilaginibacter sp.]